MNLPNRLSPEVAAQLRQVSTATLCSQLMQYGIQTCFLHGVRPLRPDLRMVGHAYTLRYVPAREDVGISVEFDNSTNEQRLAIEDLGPGDVLVIDARGDHTAGTLGSILATRAMRRGAAGIVTDGAFRDSAAFSGIDLPTYAAARNARLSSTVHHPVDRQKPIGCAGVLVMQGDVIVGDAEGVVVIPSHIVSEIASDALEQERLEAFLWKKVDQGSSIRGVYPPGPEVLVEYHESKLLPE